MTSNSAMNYDDFIDVYDINRNNAGNVSLEFEQRLKYLRSLSAADRVREIREMEVAIVSFEKCAVYRDRIKQHSKRVSECEVVLTELHAQVAAQEKEMRLFYTSLTSTYERSKLTSTEFNYMKSRNQMTAKAHQIKLDELLNLTLYQLNIYENFLTELKNEKKLIQKIRNIVKQIKKLLKEAKTFKQETKQNQIINENFETLQRCMEVHQVPVAPTYTESKENNDMENQIIIFNKKKPKFKTKPIIVQNKRKIFNKIESNKNVTRKKFNNKKFKKKMNPQIKEDVISNETKVTEHSLEENKIEEKPIEVLEKDKPVNVGCCAPKKSRKIEPKHDHSDKSSLKESIKSSKERSNSIKEDVIRNETKLSEYSLEENKIEEKPIQVLEKDENKNKENILNEVKIPKVIKKKKSQSKTNSLKSQSQNLRSNTSKSRLKKSDLKSKSKKNYPMKSKSSSKNENEEKNKVEIENENEVIEMIPEAKDKIKMEKLEDPTDKINVIKSKSLPMKESKVTYEGSETIPESKDEMKMVKSEDPKDKSESKEIEKKKEKMSKCDFINEKSKIEYLTKDEIMKKIKENKFQYDSTFPKGYLKASDIKERRDCKLNDYHIQEKEDPFIMLQRLKKERNERMIIEEKDRLIIKNREFKVLEMNEKERLKKRNKELEDHEHYLKTLKKNKKYLNTNSDELTPKAEVGEIKKLPKVKYDYQILLLESKNAVNESKHSKLYKVREVDDTSLYNINHLIAQKCLNTEKDEPIIIIHKKTNK